MKIEQLSEKELAMFIALGMKPEQIENCLAYGSAFSLYQCAAADCFIYNKPESSATSSLRRCIVDGWWKDNDEKGAVPIYRNSPTWDAMIQL